MCSHCYDDSFLLVQILAYVNKVRDIGSKVDHSSFTMADVESNIVRCPDQEAAKHMIDGKACVPASMHR